MNIQQNSFFQSVMSNVSFNNFAKPFQSGQLQQQVQNFQPFNFQQNGFQVSGAAGSFRAGNIQGFGFQASFNNLSQLNRPAPMPAPPQMMQSPMGMGGLQQATQMLGGMMQQMFQQVAQLLTNMLNVLKGALQNNQGLQNNLKKAMMQGAGALAKPTPPKPQFSEQDKKVQAHLKNVSGKGWLVSHGQYNGRSAGQKKYTFKAGIMKGYTAINIGGNKFSIENKEGEKIGEYVGKKGNKVASPIAFDLNGDGKLNTTGETTAKDRLESSNLGRTVSFDIDGDGKKDQIEWMAGTGDGLLVDNRDGNAAEDMSGKRLFGDEGGKFGDGYEKLKRHDLNNDGKLTGEELKGLEMWVDDGDAKVEAGEMKTLDELGITEISVERRDVKNERGETLMQSDAKTADGRQILTEDVWFGKKG
jgi:hypothetical protein